MKRILLQAAVLTLPLIGTAQASDPDLGRNLAATCANCHGTNGQARGDTVKPLAGVSADKIIAAVNDYKTRHGVAEGAKAN